MYAHMTMRHVTYESVMSHMHAPCHIWLHHVNIWMSHVPLTHLTPHIFTLYLCRNIFQVRLFMARVWRSYGTSEGVMAHIKESHMKESCPMDSVYHTPFTTRTNVFTIAAATGWCRANTLQQTGAHCKTLEHTAKYCNTLEHTATHCNIHRSLPQHSDVEPTHWSTLEDTWEHYSTLQHTATYTDLYRNTLTLSLPQHSDVEPTLYGTHAQITHTHV